MSNDKLPEKLDKLQRSLLRVLLKDDDFADELWCRYNAHDGLVKACEKGLELACMLNHPYECSIEDALAEAKGEK